MPQPRLVSGVWACDALCRSSRRTCIGPRDGFTCSIWATTPVTWGLANEVPSTRAYRSPSQAAATLRPCTSTSGLRRPSAVGPRALNGASDESGAMAPTAMAESASAGVLT